MKRIYGVIAIFLIVVLMGCPKVTSVANEKKNTGAVGLIEKGLYFEVFTKAQASESYIKIFNKNNGWDIYFNDALMEDAEIFIEANYDPFPRDEWVSISVYNHAVSKFPKIKPCPYKVGFKPYMGGIRIYPDGSMPKTNVIHGVITNRDDPDADSAAMKKLTNPRAEVIEDYYIGTYPNEFKLKIFSDTPEYAEMTIRGVKR